MNPCTRRLASQNKTACATELIAGAVVMSADAAGRLLIDVACERVPLGHGFRIRFHGEPLHGLQGGGNRFLIRFGPAHFRVEPLIDLAQRGIVRADGGYGAFGIRRRTEAR